MTSPFLGSASGLTPQRLRSQRYTRLSRDLYLLRDQDTLRTRLEACRLLYPDAVGCLTTAALLLKLPVDDDPVLHVLREAGARSALRHGVVVHRGRLDPDDIHDPDGLRVTTGPCTWAHLSAVLDLEALVAVGDVVAKRWGTDGIAAEVERSSRRRGAVLLRRAATLLDSRSDSPAETRGRLRLHAAGFTGLVHGVVIRDEYGGWLGQADLADEVARIAWQYEGEAHFRNDENGEKRRRNDVDRDELARENGWQVVSSTSRDDAQPERMLRKMTAAYYRAALLHGRQVLPRHLR